MTVTERLSDQLARLHNGDCWVGVNTDSVLKGIDAKKASRKIGDHLSIWQLVLHIAAWNRAVAKRVQGESYSPPPEEDFPVVTDTSAEAWKAAKQTLDESFALLGEAMAHLSPHRLDEPAVEGGSPVYHQLHGVELHTMYHLGQIGLLKKLL
jgi:hypothetical protein